MRLSRVLEAAAAPLSAASAAVFAGLSAARGKRIVHPRGVTFEGTVTFHDRNPLPFQGSDRALVRMSRAAGLPQGVPDLFGLAIKLPDLGQDLLLVTAGEDAVTRHLLVPATGFFRRPYSSVLPYELYGQTIVVGARPDPPLVHATRQDVDDLGSYVAAGRVRFDLTWGRAGTNEVATFASLVVDRPHDGDVVFNPFNSHPALKPAGGLNRLRRESYERSQRARPDTGEIA
ncbi:MAG TPA: hypothetical protein VHI71_08730 [Actinomycetota bacterium]|nr:hypothetical protein [Actinomycetota bacterium]